MNFTHEWLKLKLCKACFSTEAFHNDDLRNRQNVGHATNPQASTIDLHAMGALNEHLNSNSSIQYFSLLQMKAPTANPSLKSEEVWSSAIKPGTMACLI